MSPNLLPGLVGYEPEVPYYLARPAETNVKTANPYWAMGYAVVSELSKAYASFNAIQLQQAETKSQASAFGHRSRMLELDRSFAEKRAEDILAAGEAAIGDVSLEGGQRQAEQVAQRAARGVTEGVGSAAEVAASEQYVQALDVYRINLQRVQQAGQARQAAAAIAAESRFAGVSASNLRRSARYAAPESQLFAGLGSGLGEAAYVKSYRRR